MIAIGHGNGSMDIDRNLLLLVRAESVIGTTDPGTNGETLENGEKRGAPLDLESSADWEPDQHVWLVEPHSEPRIPETRENRFQANALGQNQPPPAATLNRIAVSNSSF